MPLQVALDIQGDATSAEQALAETSQGLGEMADKLNGAAAAAAKNNAATDAASAANAKSGKAANDNAAQIAQLANELANLAAKAAGGSRAVAGVTSSAGQMASSFGAAAAAGGPVAAITAALGAAAAAGALFWALIPDQAAKADAALKEHERLIGVVKQAYSNAKDEAAKFFDQSKAVTELQLRQNQIALQAQQIASSQAAIAKSTFTAPAAVFDIDLLRSQSSGNTQNTLGIETKFKPFEAVIRSFNDSIAAGKPDVKSYLEGVAGIGNAAAASNPQVAAAAAELLDHAKAAAGDANALERLKAAQDLLNGVNVNAAKKRLGIEDSNDAAAEYERFLKLSARRADGLRIEAEAHDMTTIAAARYRAEQELVAAAKRAGVELDAAATQKQRELADAIGVATGRLEGLRIMDELRSPAESLNRELAKLNELLEQGAINWGTYEHAAMRAANTAYTATRQQLQGELSMRQSVGQAAVELLSTIGNKSKAAAVAAIALNKALMIAQAVQNTAAASIRALAELGPIAGPPAAAAIETWGAVQIGLIAATGLVQGGQALSSGSAPEAPSGGGDTAAGGGAASGSAATAGTQAAPQTITIRLDTGGRRLLSDADLRELFDQFNEALADGARLHVQVV